MSSPQISRHVARVKTVFPHARLMHTPTAVGGAARWPPRMSRVPRTSGSSWSSARNTLSPFWRVTCNKTTELSAVSL